MKKWILVIIVLIIILLVITKGNKNILKNIELSDNSCNIESKQDTHGGFLGDGEFFAKLICSDLSENDLSENWKQLPLSKSLSQILNMKWCDKNGCNNFYEKYDVSKTINGYYYFLDRHNESKDKYDDTNLNNRNSWNFTLAIFDQDTNNIYYYELDT